MQAPAGTPQTFSPAKRGLLLQMSLASKCEVNFAFAAQLNRAPSATAAGNQRRLRTPYAHCD
jgi:hypothetical protein